MGVADNLAEHLCGSVHIYSNEKDMDIKFYEAVVPEYMSLKSDSSKSIYITALLSSVDKGIRAVGSRFLNQFRYENTETYNKSTQWEVKDFKPVFFTDSRDNELVNYLLHLAMENTKKEVLNVLKLFRRLGIKSAVVNAVLKKISITRQEVEYLDTF